MIWYMNNCICAEESRSALAFTLSSDVDMSSSTRYLSHVHVVQHSLECVRYGRPP